MNILFTQAEQRIPAPQSPSRRPEFREVLRPFSAKAFAWNIPSSHGGIGPMAIAETPDGQLIVSGGPGRSSLYRFPVSGGRAETPWVELDHPVFNLAFDRAGRLWATTGGGPLLELDPASGRVNRQFGDGLGIALAVEPATGRGQVSAASSDHRPGGFPACGVGDLRQELRLATELGSDHVYVRERPGQLG